MVSGVAAVFAVLTLVSPNQETTWITIHRVKDEAECVKFVNAEALKFKNDPNAHGRLTGKCITRERVEA